MRTQQTLSTLITGGTGKVGRRVAHRLQQAGRPVRIGSRTGTPAFDWHHPHSWDAALAGVDAVFVSYYPDISFPEAAPALERFADAATAAGVRRFVVLSGRGEPDAEPAESAVARAAEAAGADCTVLRCAWFAQNFSEHFLLQPVLDGVIALPAGEVREPFVDLDDVAEIAAGCLLAVGPPQQGCRTLDLTGPDLLSFGDVAGILSSVTGRRIDYLPVSAAQYADAAVAAGVPAEEVAPLTELFGRVLDGHNSWLSTDLATQLGRPAGTFAAYAQRAAGTGIWAGVPC